MAVHEEFRTALIVSNGVEYADQRWYSSRIGRFLSADPYVNSRGMGNTQSWNQYAYVEGDPINRVDPQGLASCLVGMVSSTVVGVTTTTFMWYPCPDVDLNYLYSQFGGGGGGPLGPPPAPAGGMPAPTPVRVPPGTSLENRQVLQDAFDNAWDRVVNRWNCLDFFSQALTRSLGHDFSPDQLRSCVTDALAGTTYRITDFGPSSVRATPTSVSVVGAQTVDPSNVFINTRGPFFSQNIYNPASGQFLYADFGTGLTGNAFRALLLLHELGHQLGLFGADSANATANRDNTQQVLDNCFRTPGVPGYQ